MKTAFASFDLFIALSAISLGVFLTTSAVAQEQYFGAALLPPKPTSAENIVYVKAVGSVSCARAPYRTIKMVNNNITIEFSMHSGQSAGIPPPRVPGLQDDTDMVEIGRLPPGDYTITTVNAECPFEPKPALGVSPFSFTVTDGGIATRAKDGGGVDPSGHWWDAENPGSGLFIWQDAAKNTQATWFTYAPDGKPIWYVFQPKVSRIIGAPTPLMTTSKPPGNVIPLTGNTQFSVVGEAGYQSYFTPILSGPNKGEPEFIIKLFYRFGDGAWQSRVLRRFSAQ